MFVCTVYKGSCRVVLQLHLRNDLYNTGIKVKDKLYQGSGAAMAVSKTAAHAHTCVYMCMYVKYVCITSCNYVEYYLSLGCTAL